MQEIGETNRLYIGPGARALVHASTCLLRAAPVDCAGGAERTGTVIACALRALGMPTGDVMRYMAAANMARGKSRGWPESEWHRLQVENFTL